MRIQCHKLADRIGRKSFGIVGLVVVVVGRYSSRNFGRCCIVGLVGLEPDTESELGSLQCRLESVLAERRSFVGRVVGCIGHRIDKWFDTVADIVVVVVVVVVEGKRLDSLVDIVVERVVGVELVGRKRIGKWRSRRIGIGRLAVAEQHNSARMSSGKLVRTVVSDIVEHIRMSMVVELQHMSTTAGRSWFELVGSCRMGRLGWRNHRRTDDGRGGTHHQQPQSQLKVPKVQE